MKILFMCVANSARSQLAHGLAKQIFGDAATIESAGSNPTKVNPFAVKVLNEIGIDITSHWSKTVIDLPREFVAELDYVITLCAEEVCPTVITKATRLHWPLPDPASSEGDEEDKLERFRKTRDEIEKRIRAFAKEIGSRH